LTADYSDFSDVSDFSLVVAAPFACHAEAARRRVGAQLEDTAIPQLRDHGYSYLHCFIRVIRVIRG